MREQRSVWNTCGDTSDIGGLHEWADLVFYTSELWLVTGRTDFLA